MWCFFCLSNEIICTIAGKTFLGRIILSGVRQGCPLLMILFAIAVDAIIRKLQAVVDCKEDQGLGAFADDIGLVIPS